MQQQGVAGGDSGTSPARVSFADRYCDFIDRLNWYCSRCESNPTNPRQALLFARSADLAVHTNCGACIAFRPTDA